MGVERRASTEAHFCGHCPPREWPCIDRRLSEQNPELHGHKQRPVSIKLIEGFRTHPHLPILAQYFVVEHVRDAAAQSCGQNKSQKLRIAASMHRLHSTNLSQRLLREFQDNTWAPCHHARLAMAWGLFHARHGAESGSSVRPSVVVQMLALFHHIKKLIHSPSRQCMPCTFQPSTATPSFLFSSVPLGLPSSLMMTAARPYLLFLAPPPTRTRTTTNRFEDPPSKPPPNAQQRQMID